MDYYMAVSLILMVLAAFLTYRIKNRKRRKKKSIAFQRKRLPAAKRRRHSLLNRDKGKVIPFPGNSGPARQGRVRQDRDPDSRQNGK